MKKAFFGVILAFALPFTLSAQVVVDTYAPYQNGPYNVTMHGHINEIDDLAIYDSVAVKCYYRTVGAGTFMETETLIATRDHGNHFEIPAFGLTIGEDYECQYSASVNYGPEILGDIVEFTMYAMAASVPETETYYAEHISNNTATLVGFVEDFAAYGTASGYFRYGENPAALDLVTPTITVSDPFGQFELDVKGLNAGKIINFQACSMNPSGESCGDIIHFLTPNKGIIDVDDLSLYSEGDCEITFDFGVDVSDRPLPVPATFRIGNVVGGPTYTKEFWYQGFGGEGITLTSTMFADAGIDPELPVIITLTISSYGEIGKTGGTVFLGDMDCDEFVGDGGGLRLSGNDISIYPNPASTKISIRNTTDGATVYITDMRGKVFGNYSLYEGVTDISTDQLPVGMYIVVYQSGGSRITKKIVIQK